MTNLDFNIEMKANAEHMSPSGKKITLNFIFIEL
jgi:hypothetical protein